MASETRGVWIIRTEKVEQLFRELDGLMLGGALPPADGLAEAIRVRQAITHGRAKRRDTDMKQPADQAHERGAEPPD